jgi:biotin transport system substrate-specific component
MVTGRSLPSILLWTSIGLLVTIGANFLESYGVSPPWQWGSKGFSVYSLGITAQIGAVFLVSCLGGRYAGVFAQIAYLVLGLIGWQIFRDGGGWSYWAKPSFGYLIGFIPGAWLCGYFAFLGPPRIERLAVSCAIGLITIHLSGIIYLLFLQFFPIANRSGFDFFQLLMYYSIHPFPSQLLLICGVSFLSICLRKLMFY